jgi:hypothetical protein
MQLVQKEGPTASTGVPVVRQVSLSDMSRLLPDGCRRITQSVRKTDVSNALEPDLL